MSKGRRNREARARQQSVKQIDEMTQAMERMGRIPGGCDSCNSYQVVRANAYGKHVHAISVFHDDDCPVLLEMGEQ